MAIAIGVLIGVVMILLFRLALLKDRLSKLNSDLNSVKTLLGKCNDLRKTKGTNDEKDSCNCSSCGKRNGQRNS